jgi:hypothetical protein
VEVLQGPGPILEAALDAARAPEGSEQGQLAEGSRAVHVSGGAQEGSEQGPAPEASLWEGSWATQPPAGLPAGAGQCAGAGPLCGGAGA